MRFLIDTNLASQVGRPPAKIPAGVASWLRAVDFEDLALSVLSVGEMRMGIERLRSRDPRSARSIDRRLNALVDSLGPRVLPVDPAVADRWGAMRARQSPPPPVDTLIAATAAVHGLTIVTRNVRDFASLGVPIIDPWNAGAG